MNILDEERIDDIAKEAGYLIVGSVFLYVVIFAILFLINSPSRGLWSACLTLVILGCFLFVHATHVRLELGENIRSNAWTSFMLRAHLRRDENDGVAVAILLQVEQIDLKLSTEYSTLRFTEHGIRGGFVDLDKFVLSIKSSNVEIPNLGFTFGKNDVLVVWEGAEENNILPGFMSSPKEQKYLSEMSLHFAVVQM